MEAPKKRRLPPLRALRPTTTGLMVVLSLGIIVVVVAPVLVVAAGSVWSAPFIRMAGRVTLANYVDFLSAPDTRQLMVTTLIMTTGASLIAVGVGGFLAWIIARTDVPMRSWLRFVPVAPFLLSGLLRDIGWVSLYSPRAGLVNVGIERIFGLSNPLFNIYSLTGLIVTMGLTLAPLAYLIMLAPLSHVNPAFEEASRASGAGRFYTLRRITVPMLRPAIMASITVTAIIAATAFESPVIIGLPGGVRTFMSSIYNTMSSSLNFSLASAQSMVYLALIGVLLWWYRRATKVEARFSLLGGRGHTVAPVETGRWRWFLFAFVVLYFVVTFLQHLATAVFLSLLPYFTVTGGGLPAMGLGHYRTALTAPGSLPAIRNSVGVGSLAAAMCVGAALVLSYVSFKTKVRGRRYAELVGTLPLAFPPLVFSVALLITFLSIPALVRFYNTNWLLLIALGVVFLPFALQVISSSLISIHDELIEASAASGARLPRTLRRIIIPLMAVALLNAGAVVFVLAFRELGAIALVVPPNQPLLPTQIFTLWNGGYYGPVHALNVISFLITSAVLLTMVVLLRLIRRSIAASRTRQSAVDV